tara:strand:- start:158 stop:382 length:225 start_codon:yes stop_codon:yes gene_type:complete
MKSSLKDTYMVVTDQVHTRDILNDLKINFKLVKSKITQTDYLKLFISDDQDLEKIIDDLNKHQVLLFVDQVLKD